VRKHLIRGVSRNASTDTSGVRAMIVEEVSFGPPIRALFPTHDTHAMSTEPDPNAPTIVFQKK